AVAGWLLHRAAKVLFLPTLHRFGRVAMALAKGTAIAPLIVFCVTSRAWVPRSTRKRVHDSYFGPPWSRLAVKLIRVGKEKLLPEENNRALTQPAPCCS